MSLNGFSGGYNSNTQVTEERAIVAPYWTSRSGNQTCSNGTLEVHYINETVDKVVFDQFKQGLNQHIKLQNLGEEFRPRELVLVKWLEIRENNQHNKV